MPLPVYHRARAAVRRVLLRPRPLPWRAAEPRGFGARARRRAYRFFVFAAVVVAVLPALGQVLQAQPPLTRTNSLNTCMETQAFGMFGATGDFPVAGPPRGGGMTPGGSILQEAAACATEFARDTLLPIGRRLFASLAVLIVAWTGLQVMFAGSFTIGQVVSLAFLIGFPLAILESYANPLGTPWGDLTFPDMVGTMGERVGAGLVRSSFASLNDTVSDIAARMFSVEVLRTLGLAAVSDDPADPVAPPESSGGGGGLFGIVGAVTNLPGLIADLFHNLMQLQTFLILLTLALVFVLLPAVIGYCSFLWGYVSYIVAIVLGPLLVPWILVPQLSFLSWGWFRSLVGASVHMLVAAVCFGVAVHLLLVPLVRFQTVYLSEDGSLTALQAAFSFGASRVFFVFAESLPLLVIAWLGVFKVGEITNYIMASGPMPEGGLGGRLGSAQRIRAIGGSAGSVLSAGGGGARAAAAVRSAAPRRAAARLGGAGRVTRGRR